MLATKFRAEPVFAEPVFAKSCGGQNHEEDLASDFRPGEKGLKLTFSFDTVLDWPTLIGEFCLTAMHSGPMTETPFAALTWLRLRLEEAP